MSVAVSLTDSVAAGCFFDESGFERALLLGSDAGLLSECSSGRDAGAFDSVIDRIFLVSPSLNASLHATPFVVDEKDRKSVV